MVIVLTLGLTASAQTGLLSYWPMDEGNGPTVQDTTGPNDLTLTNGPTWVTDHTGSGNSAIGLDASSGQYLTGGNVLALDKQAPMSAAGWVYVPDTSYATAETMGLIGNLDNNSPNDGWGILLSNKRLKFDMYGQGGSGRLRLYKNAALPTDQWLHLAVTYNGNDSAWSGITFYVDGIPVPAGEITVNNSSAGGTLAPDHNFGIGGYVGAAVGRYFISVCADGETISGDAY